MSKVSITIGCCFCGSEHKTEIELPPGWKHCYGGIEDYNHGFCETHANVLPFMKDQCPGCVSGWGDCPMWRAFDHGRSRTITKNDLDTLRTGRCPRRLNGTIGVELSKHGSTTQELDISDTATAESGSAFADAIIAYCKEYP
jgi:hypothetical protein